MIFTMPATIARRTRWIRSALFAISTAPCGLHAQTATPPGLRFDAASVRPNHTAGCRGRWNFSASHRTVTAENAPLLRIVSRAYNLTDDRVSGPAWLDSECYDITAKAAGDVTDHDLMAMLKELLKDRFHLVAHRELDERPVLALMVDEGGSKMHPYGDKVSVPSYPPFGSGNSDPSDPASDIFSAVRDQLGLRLQSQRGVLDVLKIESVDKVPTEN